MTKERKEALKVGRKMGAILGAIVFLAVGVVPGFYFGSFGTVVLLSKLSGGAVEPGVLARMIITVGTVVGIFCVGAVSIVLGSVVGTSLAYMADLMRSPSKAAEEQGAATR